MRSGRKQVVKKERKRS